MACLVSSSMARGRLKTKKLVTMVRFRLWLKYLSSEKLIFFIIFTTGRTMSERGTQYGRTDL